MPEISECCFHILCAQPFSAPAALKLPGQLEHVPELCGHITGHRLCGIERQIDAQLLGDDLHQAGPT
jgi:hypothetical protein